MRKFFTKIIAAVTAVVMTFTAAVIPVSAASDASVPDTAAMRFVDALGAGWNLGNEFDAADCTWLTDKMDYESAWSGVKTTKALIKAVRKAGFATIRIPVSWHDHVDEQFNIDSAWLKRVKKVVDWSIDEGFYVVLNIHHDVKKGFYYPSSSELAISQKYMKSVWTQLCSTFKSYDERLIFEAINEPRLKDTDNEWWYDSNNIPDNVKDSLECINKLNQTFVDTVRASGGNNKTRYLVVGGYDTDSTGGLLSKYFTMPTDSVKNKLIADVHYYCSFEKVDTAMFRQLYKTFVAKGIPVLMTEYGVRRGYEEGYDLYNKTDKAKELITEIVSCARKYGISAIVWDNNSGSKNKIGFKYIDRASATVILPTLVKAAVDAGAPAMTTVKPTVTAAASADKVKLSWNYIGGATKFAVYQYKSGKYSKVKTVTGTSATISGLKSGTAYKFIVRAYVNGKWTAITTKDAVKVKTK